MTNLLDKDPNLLKTYLTLQKIRKKEDVKLEPPSRLRKSIQTVSGREIPLLLRPYQIQGVLHLLTMRRFLLGDDCGLGKTLQCIAALTYIWESNPNEKVVVLTTKSAVPQWASEFIKFTEGVRTLTVQGDKKKRNLVYQQWELSEGPTVLIANYRALISDVSEVQHFEKFTLILDECTAFKNPSTQVHKLCKHLTKQSSRTWGLTATMIKNNLEEGFGIYSVLVPELFPTRTKFLLDHCVIRYQPVPGGRKVPQIVGHKKEQISSFKEKIDPFFLGRAKHDVASELPLLTLNTVYNTMNTSQRSKYEEALSGLLIVDDQIGKEAREIDVTKLTAIIRCQQVVNSLDLIGCSGGSSKLESLVELLSEGDLSESKVIIFTRFKEMVKIAKPYLENKLKVRCVTVTGDDSSDEREKSKNLFNDPKSGVNVIFITMAGSDAINLQSASALVFYDTPWSAGDYLQILGRMIRVGSEHENVYAVHLVTEGSIDDRVQQVLHKKMDLLESVLGQRLKKSSSASQEDMIKNSSDIDDLFAALRDDAKKSKR